MLGESILKLVYMSWNADIYSGNMIINEREGSYGVKLFDSELRVALFEDEITEKC